VKLVSPAQQESDAPRDEVAWLRSVVEGTASSVGEDFLRKLVHQMALAVGVSHAFVAEFADAQHVRTLAYWKGDRIVPNIEFELHGTPCEEVVAGGMCHFPDGVQRRFPRELGIESYLGVPLLSHEGAALGHLCVFDEAPMPADPRKFFIFRIFAARAAAELDRIRVEARLRESEDRFRDLFEEAPIAYVHEGLDSKFIRANRAALRALGITEDEVPGTYGRSFIPDTPSAMKRFHEAFASIEKGTDTSGVILEMRRKDTGAPLWIQWWSKPDRGGTYTRTMFVDITERVLMEQEQARLQAQNLYLQEEIKSVHNFEEIVGASAALRKVLDCVDRVAPTDASVLIWGETGTGKELIARAIHSISARADKPFIKINCAAMPAGLVESELFGHERGAFSGAIQRRIGRFELAHGGTIFLDEIGEVPKDVQVKLLRVLQEREFERVGGNQTIKCDVRVIAATNRLLEKAIKEGEFRADLYYRLNVFPINMPALRERTEDIPLLVQFFAQKYGPRVGRRIESVDSPTLARLESYAWPGNIRELENIIERALILSTTSVLRIDPEAMGLHSQAPNSQGDGSLSKEEESKQDEAADAGNLNSVQKAHILNTLKDTNWVIEGRRGAAVRLGVKPATLRHRMKKLGITRTQS
jgi:formate hydrogenlyase transcriptional activator